MATATINATNSGFVERLDTSSSTINWLTTTRNATTGSGAGTFNPPTAGTGSIPRSSYELSKGTYSSYNNRGFFFFDLSSINGTITAATLKIYNPSTTSSTNDIECVEATAWGGDGTTTTLATTDYDEVAFLGTGSTYSSLLSWSATSYNNFTLNATAISNMNSDGYLNCALLTQDYDYRGIAPSLGSDISFVLRFNDSTNPNKLEITYTPQTGYSHSVNGVGSSSIVSVNTVATASITNIIGVS